MISIKKKPQALDYPKIKALDILRGCPDGATVDALVLHDVTPLTIANLLNDGFVRLRLVQQHTRIANMVVTWVAITESGLAKLKDHA